MRRSSSPSADRRPSLVRVTDDQQRVARAQPDCIDAMRQRRVGLAGKGMAAAAVETHENWLEGTRYLNMQHLFEHKKEALGQAA
jgi:hypothetical protein